MKSADVNLSDQINIEGLGPTIRRNKLTSVMLVFLAPTIYIIKTPRSPSVRKVVSDKRVHQALAKLNPNEASWARKLAKLDF